MTRETLSFQELELFYDLLAESIDEVGKEQESLFLCKLSLTLANHINNIDLIRHAVAIAKRDLKSVHE